MASESATDELGFALLGVQIQPRISADPRSGARSKSGAFRRPFTASKWGRELSF